MTFSTSIENALAIRVTGHDVSGRYTVTKEFITDPHHAVVLMNVKVTGDEEVLSRLKCYALLAPHLDGGGAENSARSLDMAGSRCLLAWKNDFSLAMGTDCGFTRSSCGFVGRAMGIRTWRASAHDVELMARRWRQHRHHGRD
jgi:glucoamylase